MKGGIVSMKKLLLLLIVIFITTFLPAAIVINEFMYDMDGTDAGEYIELYNTSSSPEDISGWQVLLVNGAAGTAYNTITIPALTTLLGNDYYVIGNQTTINAVWPGVVDLNINLDNILQNGSPDAIVLKNGSATLIDAVNYEGDAVFVVGAETPNAISEGGTGSIRTRAIATTRVGSIGRLPDGADTNVNLEDFHPIVASPGSANTGISLPFSDNFDGGANAAWMAGFVQIRVVNPASTGPMVASPQGGDALEVVDVTGGGDTAYLGGAFKLINVEGYIWIPADAANGWTTGLGIATKCEPNWFSDAIGNGLEKGFYLDYQNGALGGTLKGGTYPAHSGSADLIAVNTSATLNTGLVTGTVATTLGTTTSVSKGAWNTFRIGCDTNSNLVYAYINGVEIFRGALPAGYNLTAGGVVVGFRESHAGTPVAGEGTWIDALMIDTNTSVSDWSIY